MSRLRRAAFGDELGNLRLRITRARRVLEELKAHEEFEHAGVLQYIAPYTYMLVLEKVRDALDILNRLPPGYWRKSPEQYRPLMVLDDLGNEPNEDPEFIAGFNAARKLCREIVDLTVSRDTREDTFTRIDALIPKKGTQDG